MSVADSRAYAWSTRIVLGWCYWYARGLSNAAAERQEELASDLHEQAANSGRSPFAAFGSALVAVTRTVRGVPSDLLWRWAQIRRLPPDARASFRSLRADFRVASLTVLCGAAMTTWCVFVLSRVAVSVERDEVRAATSASALMTAIALVTLLGTLLAARERTRFVGTLWLLVASQVVVRFGVDMLLPSSATMSFLQNPAVVGAPGTPLASSALGAFCLASAIWNLPNVKSTTTPGSDGRGTAA